MQAPVTPREVAAMVGIDLGQSRTHIHRQRRELRAAIYADRSSHSPTISAGEAYRRGAILSAIGGLVSGIDAASEAAAAEIMRLAYMPVPPDALCRWRGGPDRCELSSYRQGWGSGPCWNQTP